MMPKVWLANLVLVCVIVFCGYQAYSIWQTDGDGGTVERPAAKAGKPADAPGERFARRVMPAESAYDIVASQNLFSPEREEHLPEEAAPAPEAAPDPQASKNRISGEAITLFGVVILEDYRKALISNPDKSAGAKGQIWVAVGDALSNLKVAEIRKESVLLAEGKKTHEVLLYDPDKTKSRKVVSSAPSKAADAPTVITNEAPTKPSAPPPKAAAQKIDAADKRMMDNPFRRKFPKQN